MNHRDTSIGAGLLIVALVILWHVSSFPESPGQPYNAALFPGLAAIGLGVAAIILMAQGWLRQRAGNLDAAVANTANTDPDDVLDDTDEVVPAKTDVPSRLLAILLTAGAIIFYLLFAKTLGFILTGFVLLAALMWAYGVRLPVLLPVTVIATLVIHTSFYKLLKVPLPWGVLQPIAW